MQGKRQIGDKFSEEFLEEYIAEFTSKIPGVNHLVGGLTDNLSRNLFGISDDGEGVKVNRTSDGMVIEIYIEANYLVKIPRLAWDIQTKVKEQVEQLIGETVHKVNIHVQGVSPAREV